MSKNSEEAVADIIRSFEEEENLFSLKVRGVCIWRIVRSSVFSSIQNLGIGEGGAKRKDVVKAAIRSIPVILYIFAKRNQIKYGVLSYPVALRIPSDSDEYEDIYYQPILDEIPCGVRLLNGPILKEDKKSKKNVLDLDLSAFRLLAIILARVFPIKSGGDSYFKLADAISRNFTIEGISELSLKRWFSIFWWESKVKGAFFKIIGLERVFIINSGEYTILNACVENGIKIIELQHGIYTKNHPDVLSNKIVAGCERYSLFFPDVIALYGDYWVNQLSAIYKGTSVHVVSVGNGVCDSLRRDRVKNYSLDNSEVDVLVTTQGVQRKELADFINNVLINSSTLVRFIIKLHPSYDKDKGFYLREFEANDRVMVVAGDEFPTTFNLLTMVDLHASIASTCHYDALSIGVPTVVIGLPGSELVFPIVENESATLVSNSTEMIKLIESRKWIVPSEKIQQYYCKSGFIENIRGLID